MPKRIYALFKELADRSTELQGRYTTEAEAIARGVELRANDPTGDYFIEGFDGTVDPAELSPYQTHVITVIH